jgi:hypothetical protein
MYLIYRVSQDERSIFWEGTIPSAICYLLSENSGIVTLVTDQVIEDERGGLDYASSDLLHQYAT